MTALCLAACTSLTTAPPADLLSGRLALRVDSAPPRAVTARFELAGSGEAGSLRLSSPIGTTMAQARWAPSGAVLTTADGERRFADLDALAREVLGESLPLEALPDWLRGRPWAGAPSRLLVAAPLKPDAPPPSFEQLGWLVDLTRFETGTVQAARRSTPPVSLRALLDR